MSNLLNNIFFSNPLEQFAAYIIFKTKRYIALSHAMAQIEITNFDSISYYNDLYSDYNNNVPLTLFWLLVFYLTFLLLKRLFSSSTTSLSNNTEHSEDFKGNDSLFFIQFFFFFGFITLFAAIYFTLLIVPIKYSDVITIVYRTYLIKTNNLYIVDIFFYSFIIFLWWKLLHWQMYFNIMRNKPLILWSENKYALYYIEQYHIFTINLYSSIIVKRSEGEPLYNIIYYLFLFLILTNLQGMVPYCFTITATLTDTMWLASSIFIVVFLIVLYFNGTNYVLSLFLPSGTSFGLALLLVPLELISYVFRMVSLAVRLFANMMAGHTLLKVILNFSWILLSTGEMYVFSNILPITVLLLLGLLECGVALIQAYIFTILICIYLKDAFVGH